MEWFIQLTVFTQTLHVWSVFAGWLLWWHLPARKHNIARIAASSEGLRIVKAHGVWCQLSIRLANPTLRRSSSPVCVIHGRTVMLVMASITIVLIYHVIWFLQMLKSMVEHINNPGRVRCQGIPWKKVYNSREDWCSEIRLVLRHGLWNHLEP